MDRLVEIYRKWRGKEPWSVVQLPGSGSYRTYYRFFGENDQTVIAAVNPDKKENDAFIGFSRHFSKCDLPVPEILAEEREEGIYLLKDLGDVTLFSLLEELRGTGTDFPGEVMEWYRKAVFWLPRFQVKGGTGLDFSLCYPRGSFDRQSMMWDLNYFKYYFLKLVKVPFDEQKLEDDFSRLVEFLLKADSQYFMFRDFQSRNIMLFEGETYFIDYQGGRRGPLQYDIASLLYDAKADIPEPMRGQLLNEYLSFLEELIPVDRDAFLRFYPGFVLIRILQALGAYGFRGYYENKPHFLRSIPYAMKNLANLLENGKLQVDLPVLTEVLLSMTKDPQFNTVNVTRSNLAVRISSFSYKNGIPSDSSGHGGGFVFDCRALPNPGRIKAYQPLTGLDQPVIRFLEREHPIDIFLNHIYALVDQSVKQYIERDFTSLSVSFGCTGGQHRSVFCAEKLAGHIKGAFPVKVEVCHTEIKKAL